jgi:oligosaccharyltransferase complex subunit alpha (ribophorin I)
MSWVRVCLVALLVAISTDASLVNEEVSREIDLKSHLVKIATTITLKNTGDDAVTSFNFAIDPSHASDLAHISASSDEDSLSMAAGDDGVMVVTLAASLGSQEQAEVVVNEVYYKAVSPFPKEITQSQSQLVVYRGNHLFYSPYETVTQSTTVTLPSATTESYSKFGSPSKDEDTIKYSDHKEFENVAPFSQSAMKIHYENNNPFLAVSSHERLIELSHWGNIAVEETLNVKHIGAALKGSFSRYDYQRQPNSGQSSVKSFKTILPASADDVYYRDEIGNISTSNLLKTEDSVDFEIRPRFPLFGGWKTFYYFGYNLPSYNYLYSRGDLNVLKMRFVDHIMDDQAIEDFTLKIILPEGSKNINVQLPYDAQREEDSLHFTYLDTVGRPVITFKKSNLVEQHIDDFVLSYNFNRLLLLQEPLLVVAAIFLVFLTVIIVVRLDFSIAQDHVLDARLRVRGVIEQIQLQQDKRNGLYKAYESAVTKYKANKDASGFAANKKAVEKDQKEASAAIGGLLIKLNEDSKEASDKVAALNKLDSDIKDKLATCSNLAEKLISKKLTREAYLDQDGKVQKSLADLKEKIIDLTDNM